jgi:uncharacterized protein (TIGR00730 family)
VEYPNKPAGDSGAVSLADERATIEVLSSTVLGLWDVVNNLTRLRPSHRPDYRVTIFGSARIQAGSWVYAAVRDAAAELARMGCTIVTGGGPGLMQAANEGVAAAGLAAGHSVGIRVHLPFEQSVNPFVTEAYEHRTSFSRLHHFVLVSDAFVVVPGGVGTLLELAMVWQLLQVRKLEDTPLILVGPMWGELIDWARRSMLQPGFELAGPADVDIPTVVPTGEEAIALLRQSHARWAARRTPTTPGA